VYFDPTYNPLYIPYLNNSMPVDGFSGFHNNSGYNTNPYQMNGFSRSFSHHSNYNDDFKMDEGSSSFQGSFKPMGNGTAYRSPRSTGPVQNGNAGSHNPIRSVDMAASPGSSNGLVSFHLEDFLPWLPTLKKSSQQPDFADHY